MNTSGLSNFGVTTETVDIITEAFERCGKDASELSAVQLDSARRSIQFMFASWANEGPNLWAVDQLRFTLRSGVTAYTLPVDTVSILTAVVRDSSGTDIVLSPISRAEYMAIPNKTQSGQRPTQFYLERTVPPVVYVWQVPDNDTYTFIYYRMRMLQDIGALTNRPDAPARWMDAIAAGLAARLAVKWAPDRVADLRTEAAAAYTLAAAEDTESVPLRIYPDGTRAGY